MDPHPATGPGELDPVADLLRAALHDRDFRRSRGAARALAQRPAPDLPPILAGLTEGLRHADALAQRRAAQVLGALGTQAAPAIPALAEALGGPRWTVRETSAQALARVGPDSEPARVALVRCALHDRTPLVREAACLALTQLGAEVPAAVADLRAALGHPHVRLRCRALRALARLGPAVTDLTALLTRALGDSHGKVRRTAAEVLGSLGGAALPALPALLRRSHDRDPRVHAAAAGALAELRSGLPAPLQGWLDLLIRPAARPADNLRALVESPDLPAGAHEAFAAACRRRARWSQRRSPEQGAAPEAGDATPWEAAGRALAEAGRAAVAHAPPRRAVEQVRRAAEDQEAAWLTGWLWDHLQSSVEGPVGDSHPHLRRCWPAS